MGSFGELSKVCSQIVLKCLYLASIGRLDILWSLNKFARAITECTRACHKHLACLISYIHHTSEFKLYCHVGNTARQCRLGIVSGIWFCQRSRRFKIDFGENLVYLWQSHVRANKLDVQDTDFSFTQFQQKLKLFFSMQVYAWVEFQLLIFWIWL